MSPAGIQSSASISIYHPHRFMFVGNPSAGKTHLAATWPSPFFFDFDDGCRRIGAARLGFDFEVFDVLHDPGAASRVMPRIREFIKARNEGRLQYRTGVLDSLTSWSMAQMATILAANNRSDGRAQIQDYGALAEDMQTLFGACVRAFENVIVIAHEDTEKDELTGAIVSRPVCLGRKFLSLLPKYVEEMWFCESKVLAGKRTFSIKTIPDARHQWLRTAVAGMPLILEDPSYPKIAKLGGFDAVREAAPPSPIVEARKGG